MATITTTGSGNWSSTTPDAPWPSGTKPTTGDLVQIAAGHTVTLDENTAVLGGDGTSTFGVMNVAGSNTSVLDINGTVTINGCVKYTGTATTGFITVGTGDALTISYGEGVGTSAVVNTGTGYCILAAGSGVVSISNSGGTAITASDGRGLMSTSSGTTGVITGGIANSGNAYALRQSAGTIRITGGNITNAGAGQALYISGGIFNVESKMLMAAGWSAYLLYCASSTVNWIGSHTYAANEELWMQLAGTSAVLVLGTGGSPNNLAITNSGRIAIMKTNASATITTTNFTCVQQTTGAQFTCLGQAIAVTDPVIPAVSRRNQLIGR